MNNGRLASASNASIDIDATHSVDAANSVMTVNVLVSDGAGNNFPYFEVVTLDWTGTRGDYTLAQARESTGWSGITRYTFASTAVTWAFDGGRTVSSSFDTQIDRDWPTTDKNSPRRTAISTPRSTGILFGPFR